MVGRCTDSPNATGGRRNARHQVSGQAGASEPLADISEIATGPKWQSISLTHQHGQAIDAKIITPHGLCALYDQMGPRHRSSYGIVKCFSKRQTQVIARRMAPVPGPTPLPVSRITLP